MLQASPLGGTTNGLVVNHVDISQLKMAEEKIRLDGEQQATLLHRQEEGRRDDERDPAG